LETIRKYGSPPYQACLLHGGPGVAGEMKPVAGTLAIDTGILELIQTKKSLNGQIQELYQQLQSAAHLPVILAGYSWGAWLGFIFASRYPDLVKKLILISAGAFENKYNKDLMKIRIERMNEQDRKVAMKLISLMEADNTSNDTLRRFGELMTIVDSYNYVQVENEMLKYDMSVYQPVWAEASGFRDSGELIKCAERIECPVVAIHGDYDPHPAEGVEKPLSRALIEFKMIRLEKCGHTPWKERYVKETFFKILKEEISVSPE
jgi:pimeloyl-ACP methyl ester carboxylesterase